MARANACPSVVFPTPGTPSINKCPRAKMLTSASRTTSSLPRITRQSAFSRSAAFCDTATAVSGDIGWILLSGMRSAGVTDVIDRLSAISHQLNLERLLSSILHQFKLKADSRELTALLHKLGWPSSKALNPLCNRRMRRKQVPEIHSQQWLNNEQVRRGRRGHHRYPPRIRIELLQCARQSIGISRVVCPGRVGLIFA